MKYLIEKKKEERVPETIDTFFSLMAATVKKFSPDDQHFIKTRVFSLVSDIEGKYIHNQNAQTYVQQTQTIYPIPTPSPALSQYSMSSSKSTQNGTQDQEHPTCISQWHNQDNCASLLILIRI